MLTDYLFDHVGEGDAVGIRGPLGNGFPVELFEGQDMLLVAGGLGMVPLRGLLQYLIDLRPPLRPRHPALRHAAARSRCCSATSSSRWRAAATPRSCSAVDSSQGRPWAGAVGVVTELLDDVELDVARTYAVACGPPVFYKFMLEKLVARGLRARTASSSASSGAWSAASASAATAPWATRSPACTGRSSRYWDAINLPELIYT